VNHLILAPVILPAIMAPLIVLAMRHDVTLQRIFNTATTAALVVMSAMLLWQSASGTVQVYELGNWPAPFGIVLVLDRLSALMVGVTNLLALGVLLYTIGSGWDGRGKHFHALFQFQLMGINGAFLTGDAFNLFVFFEVLLIASYGLMIHAGGAARVRAGVQYVVFNLAGSTLFLFALGTLYGMTGTLNMADLAVRIADLPAGDQALVRVGGMLLLIVFAVKAALVPIHFWLPNTYSLAPAPVAALFAIMTKVGAYSILRMYTMVFPPETAATGTLFADWLMPAAVVTLIVGMVGILGSNTLGRMISFAAIGSMGTLLIAIALFTPQGTIAALYYMVHSTFAAAALFLVADLVQERRGRWGGNLTTAPPIVGNGLIAALYFGAAIGMAGMPPLSGFLGKLLVLDAARDHAQVALIWTSVIVTSLIAIVGLARAGSTLFWKAHAVTADGGGGTIATGGDDTPHSALAMVATCGILSTMAVLSAFALPITGFLEATAAQLHDPQDYIDTVLHALNAASEAE
jgi:multicomponent K+:H+ antiporter subunit D